MRRVLTAFVAVAVLSAGCSPSRGVVGAGAVPSTTTPPSTAPPTTTTPAPVVWTRCGQLECGTVPVPLDYGQPAGRQISIALNRRPARDRTRRIGSLLVNPGGPGASGVDLLPTLLDRIPTEVQARFDVVGFDPRGVGKSSPVRCLSSAELDAFFAVDPTPDDPMEKAAFVAAARRFADGCQQQSGDLLAHVGTEDAARDMDRIRAAVGDDKLTYVGFSYGTLLGATYAHLFPTNVRALVLDGAVDPSLDNADLGRVQGEGFDHAFDAFVADCRAKAATCDWKPAGGATKQAFVALSGRVDARSVRAGTRVVGPSEFLYGTAAFLYDKQTWPVLARALAQVEAGSATVVLAGFDSLVGRNPDGTFSNEQEASAAVNCLDRPTPKDLAFYERAAAEAARTAPAFGPVTAWSGLGCALWPVRPTGKAERLTAPGSPPILVVGTTNDPATPYVWAEALAQQLPQGRLLRHVGEGHTTYGENPCTTAIGNAYLLSLQIPPGALTC